MTAGCNGLCQRITAIGYGLALALLIGMALEAVEYPIPDCKPGTATRVAPTTRVFTSRLLWAIKPEFNT